MQVPALLCGIFWFASKDGTLSWPGYQWYAPSDYEFKPIIYKDMDWDPTLNPVVTSAWIKPVLTVKFASATQRYTRFTFSSLRVTR